MHTHTHTHTPGFMAICLGLSRWAGTRDIHPLMWGFPRDDTCHLLGFMVQGEDNRGRCTDNLAGWHLIWTIGAPSPPSTHHFTPDTLPAASLPIYPGFEQAPSMLACIAGGLVPDAQRSCSKICFSAHHYSKCLHQYSAPMTYHSACSTAMQQHRSRVSVSWSCYNN